ncbi:MAG TPA: glycosyltransferase family 4 protein [Nitrosopumilaceae archaeon]|nr:glycosyltransferase family 4 protein [Nitrosopumilaceae archaeon]
MKVLIVSTHVPFISGGAEILENNLKKALIEQGHEAEITKIGFKWYPAERIPEHILATRLLDFTETAGDKIDLVIGLKFPAYYVKHQNKVLWILHQHRPAYDLWGTPFQDLPSNSVGTRIREIIINSDNRFLPEAKKIFTLSKNVSNRLRNFNNLPSQHLYHPPDGAENLVQGKYDDYFFYPSRLGLLKRQDLVIQAMRHTKTNVKLVLAGRPDSKYDLDKLENLIDEYKLQDKVSLLINISNEKKVELYSNCLGAVFIPYDEDYGYVTLEAFYSKKPVITTNDSGCPLEFVNDKKNGLVVPPDAKQIASAMDNLFLDKKNTQEMGERGFKLIKSLNLSWNNVVNSLTK